MPLHINFYYYSILEYSNFTIISYYLLVNIKYGVKSFDYLIIYNSFYLYIILDYSILSLIYSFLYQLRN